LAEEEEAIVGELLAVQGSPVDIGGYYQPDPAEAAAVMRPSKTFNETIATLADGSSRVGRRSSRRTVRWCPRWVYRAWTARSPRERSCAGIAGHRREER